MFDAADCRFALLTLSVGVGDYLGTNEEKKG